jgi:hypothetical protein
MLHLVQFFMAGVTDVIVTGFVFACVLSALAPTLCLFVLVKVVAWAYRLNLGRISAKDWAARPVPC